VCVCVDSRVYYFSVYGTRALENRD